MDIHPSKKFRSGASRDAVFGSLRAKLAGETSSSAVLADLLEKLNRMQEAQARPGDFKESLDAFIARAEEYLDVVRPFFPLLVQFLPSHKGLHAAGEPAAIEATDELDWTTEVA
ncbi:MAG: hypothetical protein WA869_14350 [Alloacidobacterium sp.]|jgi:hypothetical protein